MLLSVDLSKISLMLNEMHIIFLNLVLLTAMYIKRTILMHSNSAVFTFMQFYLQIVIRNYLSVYSTYECVCIATYGTAQR